MEYIIVKNGHIFGRATDPDWSGDDQISLATAEYIPPFPEDDPGRGKFWDLDYVDGVLTWVQKDRPLTTEERLAEMEHLMNTMLGANDNGE